MIFNAYNVNDPFETNDQFPRNDPFHLKYPFYPDDQFYPNTGAERTSYSYILGILPLWFLVEGSLTLHVLLTIKAGTLPACR